ncbi:hypothetical protein BDV11DRAFT_186186 [Aspergillus similis]
MRRRIRPILGLLLMYGTICSYLHLANSLLDSEYRSASTLNTTIYQSHRELAPGMLALSWDVPSQSALCSALHLDLSLLHRLKLKGSSSTENMLAAQCDLQKTGTMLS